MRQLELRMTIVLVLLAGGCSDDATAASDARLDIPQQQDGLIRQDRLARADKGALQLKVVDTCTLPAAPAAGAINTKADVVYGSAGQTLDLAWPKGSGPFPLIVMIHGGGWMAGDKNDIAPDAERLAGVGYVVANVNYRLAKAPTNLFPACVEDVRCAVRWLRSQASSYAIDTKRVVAMGPSAGGHLAAMLALAETASGLDGGGCPSASQPVGVSGAITYYAPSDMRSSSLLGAGEATTLPNLFGKEPEQVPTLAALASTITHVHAGAPPMLLIHGTDDQVAPVAHSRNLKGALDKAQVPALLVEVAAGHDFPMLSSQATYLRSSCTALAFLEAILK